MNSQEKALLRVMFKNKIYQSDGQVFEDLFTSVMNYAEKDFRTIKPWGNIGDRKNDGYIKSTGTFYQVFAPEEIEKSYPNTVKKIHTDFNGLIEQWSSVSSFYFVINDKYKGVNADAEQKMEQIKKDYNLVNAGILTAKDIENILFNLEDDQIFQIVGMLPDPSIIKNIDYSILNEVIVHIMELPLQTNVDEKVVLPEWEKKIKFNGLSNIVENYLNHASQQLVNLEIYLSNNGDFAADTLREKLSEVYMAEKDKKSGDDLFFTMLNTLSPKQTQAYQNVVIVIMAKYFESCDIFEEPKEQER